jgi:hypothetical protein
MRPLAHRAPRRAGGGARSTIGGSPPAFFRPASAGADGQLRARSLGPTGPESSTAAEPRGPRPRPASDLPPTAERAGGAGRQRLRQQHRAKVMVGWARLPRRHPGLAGELRLGQRMGGSHRSSLRGRREPGRFGTRIRPRVPAARASPAATGIAGLYVSLARRLRPHSRGARVPHGRITACGPSRGAADAHPGGLAWVGGYLTPVPATGRTERFPVQMPRALDAGP